MLNLLIIQDVIGTQIELYNLEQWFEVWIFGVLQKISELGHFNVSAYLACFSHITFFLVTSV
jgi:hypothetical protein